MRVLWSWQPSFFIRVCCGGKIQNMEIKHCGSTACQYYFSVLKYRILRTGSTFKNRYFDNQVPGQIATGTPSTSQSLILSEQYVGAVDTTAYEKLVLDSHSWFVLSPNLWLRLWWWKKFYVCSLKTRNVAWQKKNMFFSLIPDDRYNGFDIIEWQCFRVALPFCRIFFLGTRPFYL